MAPCRAYRGAEENGGVGHLVQRWEVRLARPISIPVAITDRAYFGAGARQKPFTRIGAPSIE